MKFHDVPIHDTRSQENSRHEEKVMEIIRGPTTSPGSTAGLIDIVKNSFADEEGVLYIGYPVLSSADAIISIDALFISRTNGVIAIDLVEEKDAGNYGERQDEFASLLVSKFIQHKVLRKGVVLLAEPRTLTYAPLLNSYEDKENHRLVNNDDIVHKIREIKWSYPDVYEPVLSVIQSISTLRRNRRREVDVREDSLGSALQALENSISVLDKGQSKAVIESVEGVQRLRGLAGSGKTIVLALKAAFLHSIYPDWKIAVTFYTRSLQEQFVQLINNFVFEQTKTRPNENLKILHAWGAQGEESQAGMYSQFCFENGATYLDFGRAANRYGYEKAFAGAVTSALNEVRLPKQMFDAVLIDEAQDFDPSFLQLCYSSLSAEKRLVYAYDELQSLTESGLPAPEELFGSDEHGNPRVVFDGSLDNQDIILNRCYRNSRPVFSTAHALGFGLYRQPNKSLGTGLIQMFDRAELWTEIGYEIASGELRDDCQVTLRRTNDSSPVFLEEPGKLEDLVVFQCFDSASDQDDWVANQIEKNLTEDGLQAEDIIVINPNPKSTASMVGPIRKILYRKKILSHLADVDTERSVFFKPNEKSVAFTGVYRAKGNEAGMVYVINSQDCFESFGETARVRNLLFTAMTRSKAWVRVVGHGVGMKYLHEEYRRVVKNNFSLRFTYPGQDLRRRLRIVNRDMSSAEKSTVMSAKRSATRLVRELNSGKVRVDDLDDETLENLRALIGS